MKKKKKKRIPEKEQILHETDSLKETMKETYNFYKNDEDKSVFE